jgi:hypothetical protein
MKTWNIDSRGFKARGKDRAISGDSDGTLSTTPGNGKFESIGTVWSAIADTNSLKIRNFQRRVGPEKQAER